MGRLLGESDDLVDGAHPVAVLSSAIWESRFGGDPAIVGRTILVNGLSFEVVGITPPEFRGTSPGISPAVYLPLSMRANVAADWGFMDDPVFRWIYVFGRLRDGASFEATADALSTAYAGIQAAQEPGVEGAKPGPMAGDGGDSSERGGTGFLLEDGRRGQSVFHTGARIPALLLFITTGAVLFIGCANLANLLLARGVSRAAEMSVRVSLGASRTHLVRQLMIEAVLLSCLGGALGYLVAHVAVSALVAWLPTALPPGSPISGFEGVDFVIRLPVFLFALGLSIGVGVLFGIVPALHGTRKGLMESIRSSSRAVGLAPGASLFRAGLVHAQVALSLTLLVAAGLFLQSLARIREVDPGVSGVEQVVTFALSPDLNRYTPESRLALFERIEGELAAMPGVVAVTSAQVPVLAGSSWGGVARVASSGGEPLAAQAYFNAVGPGFASALGMDLARGREFEESDRMGAPRVALVNEVLAEEFGLGEAIGAAVELDGPEGPYTVQVVGVLRDAPYARVNEPIPPVLMLPSRQLEGSPRLTFYVRSSLPPSQLMNGIRETMERIDPQLPLETFLSMSDQIDVLLLPDRVLSGSSAAFAMIATGLALIGVYGIVAFSFAARRGELGLRIALGASARAIRAMVMKLALRSVALGGAVGLVAAYFVGEVAEAVTYQADGGDPAVFVGAGATLVLLVLASAYLPARRAARVDPMASLRAE
jgi:predicted permease